MSGSGGTLTPPEAVSVRDSCSATGTCLDATTDVDIQPLNSRVVSVLPGDGTQPGSPGMKREPGTLPPDSQDAHAAAAQDSGDVMQVCR
jgi:hypothetical protein